MCKKLLSYLMLFLLSENVFCLGGVMEINVQNATQNRLFAKVVDRTTMVFETGESEVDSIRLSEPNGVSVDSLCIVLKNDAFVGKEIVLSKDADGLEPLLKIIVTKNVGSSPEVRLSPVIEDIACKLYIPLMGGGTSFVIAIGETGKDEDVSVQSLKQHQKHGRIQSYRVVEQ